MNNEESLQELLCALSSDKHFLVDPVTLDNCKHSFCKSCLEKEKVNLNAIECKICGITTEPNSTNNSQHTQGSGAYLPCRQIGKCLTNVFKNFIRK